MKGVSIGFLAGVLLMVLLIGAYYTGYSYSHPSGATIIDDGDYPLGGSYSTGQEPYLDNPCDDGSDEALGQEPLR